MAADWATIMAFKSVVRLVCTSEAQEFLPAKSCNMAGLAGGAPRQTKRKFG